MKCNFRSKGSLQISVECGANERDVTKFGGAGFKGGGHVTKVSGT